MHKMVKTARFAAQNRDQPMGSAKTKEISKKKMNSQPPRAPTSLGNCEGPPLPAPNGAQTSLAMVYSPEQAFEGLYSPEDALAHGSLFEALHKPWMPESCRGEVPS